MKKEGFHPFKSILWKVSVLWAWETLLFVKNTHFCWPTENCVGLQKMPAYRNTSWQEYQPTEIPAYRNASLQKMPAYRKCQPTEIPAYRNVSLQKISAYRNTSLQECQPTENISLWKMLAYRKCQPTENASLQKMPAYRNVSVYRKMHLPTEESICQRKCVSLQKNPSAYRNLSAYKKKHRPTEMVCKKISELYRLVSTLNTIHDIPFNLY